MLKRIGICLILFSGLALAQGVRYENHPSMKQRADGALVPTAATIAVCTQPANTSTQPCSPLATLYTDATLATPCSGTNKDGSLAGASNCSNPLITDSHGNYHFYAAGTQVYTIQVYGSGLTTNVEPDVPIAGSLVSTAGTATVSNLTAPILNKSCYVDGTTYTTIASAYNDTTNCQVVHIPAKVGCYTETLSSALTFNRNNTAVVFDGCAIITQGANQVVVSPSVKDFYFGTPYIPWGTDNGGGDLAVTLGGYTGTGAALKLGDGTADVIKVKFESVHIDLPSAGANARCVDMNRVVGFDFNKVSCFFGTGAGQVGFFLDGTGNFTGLGTFYEIECQAAIGSSNNVCIKESNGVTAVKIIGGHCTLINAGTSACIDLTGPGATADEAVLFNYACDNANTCVKVETTFSGALWGFLRADSTVTNIANFGAGTVGNQIFVNSNFPWTDTSGNNSVIYPPQFQVNSLKYQQTQTATTYGVQDVQVGGNNGGWVCTHAGNCKFGSQGGGAGQDVIVTNTGTTVPETVNVADLGLTSNPWRSLFVGTAATNNFKFQPAATAGARIITITDPVSPTTVGLPLTIGSGTAAMTTALIGAGACGTTVTVAATGVATTDTIMVARNAAVTAANGGVLTLNTWPTAGNVNFNYCNPTAAGVTPTAMTVNWSVAR